MTVDYFLECLSTLHWSQRHLARILNIDQNIVLSWGDGSEDIPPEISHWLNERASYARTVPFPSNESSF
ncbi:hypothetical protein AA15669_1644 [Saccharibacter floricola DSM 15669]|uniref:Uncharacterized protein n=1 Tax=Saccharibacter floricola DSM 15669 TaxID=1123227 RepID=A0ABQ0P0B3_9PROT|nr:hypothetical protein AA15669_1644 [Saccharibacter floricola DSM 15669]